MEEIDLIGMIIMAICCFGSGIICFSLGCKAEKAEKPVNFWAGKQVDQSSIANIRGYNHANAVMWKIYAVPYFVAGLLSCFSCFGEEYMVAGAVILLLACVPGLILLILRYRQIEKQYIIR